MNLVPCVDLCAACRLHVFGLDQPDKRALRYFTDVATKVATNILWFLPCVVKSSAL